MGTIALIVEIIDAMLAIVRVLGIIVQLMR
jgi:hypothetical protein